MRASAGGEFSADGEELALEGEQPLGPGVVGLRRPGQAERRDGLVEGPVRLGVEVVLGHATAVQQAGLAAVPAAGDDAAHPTHPPSREAAMKVPKGSGLPLARSSTHLVAASAPVVASPTPVVICRVSSEGTSPAAKIPATLVVTGLAWRVRNIASSTAASPPPITARCSPLKKAPSQTAR